MWYSAYHNYMDSRFSRFADNPQEIDKNSECMSCEEYYFTSSNIYFLNFLTRIYTTYDEKPNLWSYHNYKNSSKNRFYVLANAF